MDLRTGFRDAGESGQFQRIDSKKLEGQSKSVRELHNGHVIIEFDVGAGILICGALLYKYLCLDEGNCAISRLDLAQSNNTTYRKIFTP